MHHALQNAIPYINVNHIKNIHLMSILTLYHFLVM